jgi:peptidoglycan/LPS O-acetylase OafA/YrhL
VTVAVSHISSIYQLPADVRIAIDAVCNAHACVVLFFVLSGYVLTNSLVRRELSWSTVTAFYLNRLFRLFPALWAASAISALFLFFWPPLTVHPEPSFWFRLYLHSLPSTPEVILAIFAIDKSLIMPVWTIFIELVGSAMMPLLAIVALARVRSLDWILIAMAMAAYMLAHAPHRLNSLVYMFDFALGAWLASGRCGLFARKSLFRLSAAAFALVFFRSAWFAILNGHATTLYLGYDDPVPMLIESVAAAFLVGALASEHGRLRCLRSAGLIWLGDVSYSLYLIHFPVAILTAKMLSPVFSNGTKASVATAVLLAVGLSLSGAAAFVIHRFIELPSMTFGKKISSPLARSKARAEV